MLIPQTVIPLEKTWMLFQILLLLCLYLIQVSLEHLLEVEKPAATYF